ncbi:hypothetical protein BC629DRAFT_1484734 [Irpex lacteus]|nr:hypothetical protein BC629DRAFT_1484734 [Irpex lacteus]
MVTRSQSVSGSQQVQLPRETSIGSDRTTSIIPTLKPIEGGPAHRKENSAPNLSDLTALWLCRRTYKARTDLHSFYVAPRARP